VLGHESGGRRQRVRSTVFNNTAVSKEVKSLFAQRTYGNHQLGTLKVFA
jgi:hypothetical protein